MLWKIFGFTGTQRGMTDEQKIVVERMLGVFGALEFHHGDCIGADAEAHEIARRLRITVRIHPPTNRGKRAFCSSQGFDSFWCFEPRGYLERNHDIVDACHTLICCPHQEDEILRSGTWATLRYAKKIKKDFAIITPRGNVKTNRSDLYFGNATGQHA